MYMFPPANTQLEPERMMNYELSLAQQFGSQGQINANIFYIDGENLITTTRIDGRPRNVNMGEFKNWGIELAGSYNLSKHWRINANYSFLNMEKPIEGAPKHKLYAGVNFHSGRWSLISGLQHISGLYITTGEHPAEENYTLFNATASYRIIPSATLFLKGENLLAEQYQTFAGFPMPKATFMGGVKITL
jgi:iron complex outermembrane receptor protein